MGMLDNYPPGMTDSDWEYLDGINYCEECGCKLKDEEYFIGDHMYCEDCYNEIREEHPVCDRCGADIEGDPCRYGDLMYCKECYDDMVGIKDESSVV